MFKKENLRKNFLRVKQIADQNLGRVEKTEVLSDDLQISEKRVDLIKHVCSNTVKKLAPSLLGAGTTTDPEKRLKKMPEASVGHSMIESASILGTDNVMGQLYQMCGDCQSALANKHLQYELDVEKKVLEPLQEILDVEIPQIGKFKKALNKVTLDMDSAKSRWNSAVKQTSAPGVNMASASAKADVVKDELGEASARVDQAKDAYTTGIFNFISKEADHSQNLLNLLEAQAAYHREALDIIENMIPKMKDSLHCNPTKPVYGVSLEEHLRVTGRDIAQVLEACVCFLLEVGLDEEGLFRIAGMASKVKKLKASFDAGVEFEDNGELDPHTVAGAMKQYLRELPEPLLTFNLFQEFMAAAQQPQDKRLQAIWCAVDKLPKPNYDNFRYLIKFLAKLTEKSDVNKMTPGNIAIVIGPNLIWSEGDNGPNMMNTGILSLITELIVQHADWFFPGDIDFHSTQRGTAPEHRMTESVHQSRRHVAKDNAAIETVVKTTKQQQQQNVHTASNVHTSQNASSSFSQPEGAVSGHMTSPEASTSSSESTSLSEITPRRMDYENADTLERRDSIDNYMTAKGELSTQSSTLPAYGFAGTGSSFASTNKRSNPPVLKFNPKDREKYGKQGTGKPKSLSQNASPLPKPESVHADMYSTAFALQSLGDGGTWPSYLSKVRAIWDDQLQTSADTNSDKCIVGNSTGKGHSRSNQEINFGVGTSAADNSSPGLNKSSTEVNNHSELERTSSDQSGGSTQSAPQSSPVSANQEASRVLAPPQTPPTVSRSPSISPVTSSSNLQGAPIAESEDMHPPVMRRPTRKPAPPPPPERPYSVAVSASIKPGQQSSQFQTWPRNTFPPVGSDSPPPALSQTDKHKTLPPDRPHPPERISSLPGQQATPPMHHPDRPKVPPPVVPPGHQRSASTGAPVTIPGSPFHLMDSEPGTSSTNSSPYLYAGSGADHMHTAAQYSTSNQLTPQSHPDKLHANSFNRHSMPAARGAHTLPPPPPPPADIVEETHL